jgi:hypothetical protein
MGEAKRQLVVISIALPALVREPISRCAVGN